MSYFVGCHGGKPFTLYQAVLCFCFWLPLIQVEHVHAFGLAAPAAAGAMHFGATSCFITDNAELSLNRDPISRIKSNDFFKPNWDDLDGMFKAELYIGRNVEIIDRYCGPGSPIEKALVPSLEHINGSCAVELNV